MNLQSFVGECAHKEREEITSEGGAKLATRCRRCHDMRAFRACRQCNENFEIPATGSPPNRYCGKKCRAKASRLRVKARKAKQAAA